MSEIDEQDPQSKTVQQSTADTESGSAPRDPKERLRELEEEGDIAADYLEELLDIMDLDGDIDIDVEGDRARLEIQGADELSRMNGSRGDLMEALQELTRLAVQTSTGERSRLLLDIDGFRKRQRRELEEAAREAIARVKETGEAVPMRPMNPYERKIVHDCVKQESMRSDSAGEGRSRHVVIHPDA